MYINILIIVLVIVSIIFLTTTYAFKKKEGLKSKNKDYLEGIDVIYWINLDRSTDRRKSMEKMFEDPIFKGKKIVRISAVDGKASNIDTVLNDNFEGMLPDKFSKVEYACLLSHLKTIKQFSESTGETALIMEDDMTLEYKPYWKKSVNQIIKNAPSDWELIQLCININSPLKKLYTLNTNGIISCNGAYIVNKRGSLKLNDEIFKLHDTVHVADVYIFNKLTTYAYKYPMFTYGFNQSSTIHQEHLEQHDTNKKIIDNFIKGRA